MNYTLIWSDRSIEDIDENLAYLYREWGSLAAMKFLDRIDEALLEVKLSPKTYYTFDKKKQIHKFIINAKITLYYMIKDQNIMLITFWNNLKETGKLEDLFKGH